MNKQQYNRLKTGVWVVGLSLSVYLVYTLTSELIIIGIWKLTGFYFTENIIFYMLFKDFGVLLFGNESDLTASVRSLELYDLGIELLVAICIITGIRYYLAHAQKDYKGMMSGRKWDDTTSLYIGFAILSFVGMLFLCKAHLLHSGLMEGLRAKELAIFPLEWLYWSKIKWIMVVPMYTEILYRGFIFRQCKQNGLSELSTILLSAFGFSLIYKHVILQYEDITLMYIPTMVPHIWQWYTYKFVLGYILAMVYVRTQRIDLAVMLQSLHNFLMCLFDLSGIGSDVMFWQVIHLLLMLGVQYIICYKVRFTRDILFGPSAEVHARTASED